MGGSSCSFSPLSQQGLNPIKPVYDPGQPDGRLNLTASVFNQLSQYISSPGHRGYYYAELAIFFHSGGHNHCQYSLRLGGWLRGETVYLPTTNQAQCRASALIEINAFHYTKPCSIQFAYMARFCHICYGDNGITTSQHCKNIKTTRDWQSPITYSDTPQLSLHLHN